jgi:hypothetical protein
MYVLQGLQQLLCERDIFTALGYPELTINFPPKTPSTHMHIGEGHAWAQAYFNSYTVAMSSYELMEVMNDGRLAPSSISAMLSSS